MRRALAFCGLLAGCSDQLAPTPNPCANMIGLALVLDERGQIVEESPDTVTIQWAERATVATFRTVGERCVVSFSR